MNKQFNNFKIIDYGTEIYKLAEKLFPINRSLSGNDVNLDVVKSILNKYKVNKICVGHTPQENVNSVANGSVWRVDVGLSRAFGNNPIQYKIF